MKWFEVDRKGLAQLLEKRGRAFAVCELVQNAWDQNVSEVAVTISQVTERKYTISVVDDDPDGWLDISHAFTLFAPSSKKADPTKRGRFNLGEKLVLALCSEAEIVSVTSAVRFDAAGRHALRRRRTAGSEFLGTLLMTKDDLAEIESTLRSLLAPRGISTAVSMPGVDSFTIDAREPVQSTTVTLPTLLAGEEGELRPTRRQTTLELYEPRDGEEPTLYEMGIPVVTLEGDDRWHINVQQKVPLNLDRDNVTPGYLREVRVTVINVAHGLLTQEESLAPWVTDATDDARCEDAAIEKVMGDRFGEKRVAYDPSDMEANALAVTRGYTVVSGGSLSKGQWKNVRASGAIKPSGRVTPSPKPYSDDPNAPPVDVVPHDAWTEDQKAVEVFALALFTAIIGHGDLAVRIVRTGNRFAACYGGFNLDLNLRSLGHKWFRPSNVRGWVELLIHEFAHHYESNHLSAHYYNSLCLLGARLAEELCQDGSTVRKLMRRHLREGGDAA